MPSSPRIPNPLARALALSLASLALSAPLACSPTDPKNPKTWEGRLGDTDAHKRAQAMQELRKMKSKSSAPLIAPLLKDPQVREEAALALGDLGGPGEVQPLLDAIDTTVGAGSDQVTRTANRTNLKIADALGLIGAPGDGKVCQALLRLARAKDDLVRLSAVQSLGLLRCMESVSELTRLIDDESAPPILIKKAIVSLGQIGDASAIPALEHAMVLEKQGVSFLSESSFALFLIGTPSVQPMIQLLTDADPIWAKWAKDNNRAPAGTYAKAEIVLGDLGDKAAVAALTQRLGYTDPDPLPDTSHLLTGVVRQFAADALGRMRIQDAAPKIVAITVTKEPSDEDLCSFAANALVWIGDRSQVKELIKRAQTGSIRPRVALAQGAAMLGDATLIKDLDALAAKEKKGATADCVKSAIELTGAPLTDEKTACDKLSDAFTLLELPLQAAQACSTGDAAAQNACWTGKMADKAGSVRARAAYELGRSALPSAVAPLIKGCTDEDLNARLAAIRALEWFIPVDAAKAELKAAAPQLAAQLAKESGRVQFIKIDEELKRLQVKLSRL